jgi:hypothetical protein
MLAGKRCMTNLEHSLRSTHVTRAHDCMNCLMSTFFFCSVLEVASEFRLATDNRDCNGKHGPDSFPKRKKKRDGGWNCETYSTGDL